MQNFKTVGKKTFLEKSKGTREKEREKRDRRENNPVKENSAVNSGH